MQNTSFQTITVNAQGAKQPSVLAKAATVPLRVLVRNVGAEIVFIGSTTQDVDPSGEPTGQTYRLPQGAADVFVLAPMQSLLAITVGAGGLVSVTTSESIPSQIFGG